MPQWAFTACHNGNTVFNAHVTNNKINFGTNIYIYQKPYAK